MVQMLYVPLPTMHMSRSALPLLHRIHILIHTPSAIASRCIDAAHFYAAIHVFLLLVRRIVQLASMTLTIALQVPLLQAKGFLDEENPPAFKLMMLAQKSEW